MPSKRAAKKKAPKRIRGVTLAQALAALEYQAQRTTNAAGAARHTCHGAWHVVPGRVITDLGRVLNLVRQVRKGVPHAN